MYIVMMKVLKSIFVSFAEAAQIITAYVPESVMQEPERKNPNPGTLLNDPDSCFHKEDSRVIFKPSSLKVSHNGQYREQYITMQSNQPPDFYEPLHPGIDLTLLFRERNLTVEAVASECQIDASKLHEIVGGNIDLDDDTINRLSAIFDPEIIASIQDVRTIYEHDLKSARKLYNLPKFP